MPTIVDYQFKALARSAYGEASLARFFGVFYAALGGASLLFQLAVTRRLLARIGVLGSLLVLPGALGAGLSTTLALPALAPAAATKFADAALRYSLQSAASPLLVLPLPARVRAGTTALLDGVVKPLAQGGAGLLLLVLQSFLPLRSLAAVGLLLVAAWGGVVALLRGEYVRALLKTLHTRRFDLEGGGEGAPADPAAVETLLGTLTSPEEGQAVYALQTLARLAPEALAPRWEGLLSDPRAGVRVAALQAVERNRLRPLAARIGVLCLDPEPEVRARAVETLACLREDEGVEEVARFLDDPDPRVRRGASVGLVRWGGVGGMLHAAGALEALLARSDAAGRRLAAEILGGIGARSFYQPLVALLGAAEPEVRRAAAVAAGEVRHPALVPPLLGALEDRRVRGVAGRSLVRFGDEAVSILLGALDDRARPTGVRLSLPRLLRQIGSPAARSGLVQRLEHPEEAVRHRILRALSGWVAAEEEGGPGRPRVEAQMRREILEGARRSVLAEGLRPWGESASLLIEALAHKSDRAIERVFLLLALGHSPEMLRAAFANLKSPDPTQRANAVEIVDTLVHADLKPLLLALLEAGGEAGRRSRVRTLARLEVPERGRALEECLGDPDPWVRACALHVVPREGPIEAPFRDAIRRAAEDPDPIVREEARRRVPSAPGPLFG